jgi:hypothetical protein
MPDVFLCDRYLIDLDEVVLRVLGVLFLLPRAVIVKEYLSCFSISVA